MDDNTTSQNKQSFKHNKKSISIHQKTLLNKATALTHEYLFIYIAR